MFFIIPGFTHEITNPQYTWLKRHLTSLGYSVKIVPIRWKRHVMSDHLQEFLAFFDTHKTEENHVLGFSFGAMIAFLSAPQTQPKHLYLCSLSPYFAEDLKFLKPSWQAYIGTRRMIDFKRYRSLSTAKLISSDTSVFCGEQEGEKYPQLLKRCHQVATTLLHGLYTLVERAPHQLDFPTYKQTLKQAIH